MELLWYYSILWIRHTIIKDFGIGLSVSPALWQTFMNNVLDEIPDRKHVLAIIDVFMLHPYRKVHLNNNNNNKYTYIAL